MNRLARWFLLAASAGFLAVPSVADNQCAQLEPVCRQMIANNTRFDNNSRKQCLITHRHADGSIYTKICTFDNRTCQYSCGGWNRSDAGPRTAGPRLGRGTPRGLKGSGPGEYSSFAMADVPPVCAPQPPKEPEGCPLMSDRAETKVEETISYLNKVVAECKQLGDAYSDCSGYEAQDQRRCEGYRDFKARNCSAQTLAATNSNIDCWSYEKARRSYAANCRGAR